jgi:hypothetical protein
MGLLDMILKAVDADYVPLERFTAQPGDFKAGNRVQIDDTDWRGRPKTRYQEVVKVKTNYRRDGEHYDTGWARRVDSLRGCNCGRPGCPG